MLAMQYQLDQSQWWTPDQLRDIQLAQLGPLVLHAYRTVPFYRDHYHKLGFRPKHILTPENWSKIPIITRKQIQDNEAGFLSDQIPADHGSTESVTTSGSTGMPITVHGTQLSEFFWRAFTLREHLWHQRDLGAKMAVIRYLDPDQALPPHGENHAGWGPSVDLVYKAGPLALLNIKASIEQQMEWLQKQSAQYLLTFPSNLLALAKLAMERNIALPTLKGVRTVGEVVGPELRKACSDAWGVPLTDQYSCQEGGYLALQCPEHTHYHVQAEGALVEILNESNEPCAPGEIGKVVVTFLHNFASPLIRYEIGDFAEVGAPCPCGRGLPVITRILGRTRNMIVLPSGARRWPLVGSNDYRGIAPISQFQLIQNSLEDIEVKLVVARALTSEEEQRLTKVIHSALGHAFHLTYSCVDAIPRSAGGKHEDFICRVDGLPG
jgi:phenylacetate-CoA ligase